jgi:RimJ/RimL family protein N-acetyltransferase
MTQSREGGTLAAFLFVMNTSAMKFVKPITLAANGIQLVPLSFEHEAGLQQATADGELWKLRITGVPSPAEVNAYIQTALDGREAGHRFAFAVIDEPTGKVLGCTSYHDIVPSVRRVEIGYTWYAKSVQRTHVNTTCKLLLLTHAFEDLRCNVVGWRTDNFNFASQRAIERLGAKKDGVIRGHVLRRDGTIRDTVMYSVHQGEWTEVRAHLNYLLSRYDANS